MLASGIQLEGWWLGMGLIWAHIALGIAFFLLIGLHLYLHFQWKNWFAGLSKQKSSATKWLALFGALTLLSAIIATIHMFITWHHSAAGGWHGKIGFVFLAFVICHAAKRHKFYGK